jgi:hypothetical protein
MKWEIINKFSLKNQNYFRSQDVFAEFPERSHYHLSKVLASMVNMGMLANV